MRMLWAVTMAMTVLAFSVPALAGNPSMRLVIENSGKYKAEVVVKNNDESNSLTKNLPAKGEVVFTESETSYKPELPFNQGWDVTLWVTAPGQSTKHKCPFTVEYTDEKTQCKLNQSVCPKKGLTFLGHCEMVLQIDTSEIP